MILKFDLPTEVQNLLKLSENEKLYYSVPCDIDDNGKWTDKGYTVVTSQNAYVVINGKIVTQVSLADCEKTKSEVTVGGGLLVTRCKGEDRILASYSAKHRVRYSYIARGMNILSSGRDEEVISKEYETICPKCHRAIPGTKECPHCSKKGGFRHDFMKLLKPYGKSVFGITLLMISAGVVTLLNPEIQKHLVDDVLKKPDGSIQTALLCLLGMFLLGAGIVVINVLKSYFCTLLGARIAKDLRKTLFDKIQTLSLQFINDRRPGELMNRVVNDTGSIREFMQNTFCNLFTVVFIFAWDVIFMLILNWKLALFSFITVPIGVWMTNAFRQSIHRRFHLQYKKDDDVSSNLQDVISGMRVVKTYGKEQKEKENFDRLADEYCAISYRNERFWAVFNPIIKFLMSGGIFLVVLFGGMQVLNEAMSTGELLQFITYTTLLYQYLDWMTAMPREITRLVGSMERINDVLAQEPFTPDVENAVEHDIEGEIEFKHATFGYKSYQPVLEDINLKVKKGEMIGIVGHSGSGKSTLINLLMRLYEIDDGELFVDGVPLKDMNSEYYHQQIGVVLQETFLFTGTILSNIRFAKPEATYEEVIRAAKLANAHEFISKMPDGYNTYVGEKGFTLSGGERQRIAIARAILKEPRILILDEATASLDTESEFLIQQALDNLTNGRTTFAIAHRLSTLQNADRLLVIDGHSIAEIGSHDELVAQKGIYYNLVKAQLEMQGEG
ncbi:MAG: ABC transporter ATP-binding protein/permease [Lachnospiraceae bacterium]|nr:ABC transporter ATP-binding protein/permease [Lachnospiraceae bacterium]